ncbi:hypothetical protein ACVOMV_33260 [Mesorhizobium atlanticum]
MLWSHDCFERSLTMSLFPIAVNSEFDAIGLRPSDQSCLPAFRGEKAPNYQMLARSVQQPHTSSSAPVFESLVTSPVTGPLGLLMEDMNAQNRFS